jgi:hypothetical protein
LLLAAGLGLAIPASPDAKLRFRPCDDVEEGGGSARAAAFGGLVR